MYTVRNVLLLEIRRHHFYYIKI